VLAPRLVEKVPASQSVQFLTFGAPMMVEYVPASQNMQDSLFCTPTSDKKVPASHRVHVVFPVIDKYEPAGHFTQVDWLFAPNFVENVPLPHSMQVSFVFAPSDVE